MKTLLISGLLMLEIAACSETTGTPVAQSVPDSSSDVTPVDARGGDVTSADERLPDSLCVFRSVDAGGRDVMSADGDVADGSSDAPIVDVGERDTTSDDQGPACSNPPYLRSLNECSPGTPGCYVLSDEWRLQGPVGRIPESKTCKSAFDTCGCDADAGAGGGPTGGGTCAPCQTCVVWTPPSNIAGPGFPRNGCALLCLTDDECRQGERCWEGLCAVPECVLDSECARDRCGHCTQRRQFGHVAVVEFLRKSTCVYEGPCRADSCFICDEGSSTPYATLGPTHTCR